jgi:hypothetical protein
LSEEGDSGSGLTEEELNNVKESESTQPADTSDDTASFSDEDDPDLPMCASARLHASESGMPALLVVSVASVMYFVAYST